MDIQKTTSIVSIVVGLLVLIITVALLQTPVTDIGMLSTVLVFVLLGVVGLMLGRKTTA